MLEDPKFTLKILQHIASNEVGFPANLSLDDLHKILPEENFDTLKYHVLIARQCGLLMCDYSEISTLSHGVLYDIGPISGLTAKGGQYVTDADSKLWKRAWEKIEEAGLDITTGRLVQVLSKLISETL